MKVMNNSIDMADLTDKIIVNRHASGSNSNMTTECIIKVLDTSKKYQILSNNLVESFDPVSKAQNSNSKDVKYIKIPNKWDKLEQYVQKSSNILGNNGLFECSSTLNIPISSIETLGFYGAKLYKKGDIIQFESNKPLPLTIMDIGRNYVNDYLLQESGGGGCYLEYHDTPHFHAPLNCLSSGYLILGKIEDNFCYLSAFQIPLDYAIYTSPFTIHCDAFLIGKYLVVYTITDYYSTVLLRHNKQIAKVVIQ